MKNFLNKEQVNDLKKLDWIVNSKANFINIYSDDSNFDELCKEFKAKPKDGECLSILCVAHLTK